MTQTTYNLLRERWLPISTKGGAVRWIAPHEVVDRELRMPGSARPDFDGAIAQFLIGLLQTAFAPESHHAWKKCFAQRPKRQMLSEALLEHEEAFHLDGSGPRFMQELDFPGGGAEPEPIERLLIDAPGNNTIRNNVDHFIKRGEVSALSYPQVAIALYALQANAPSGGKGHRTSLRGGGPLSTIVLGRDLWETLWLNVLASDQLDELSGGFSGASPFPWMRASRLSRDNTSVGPAEGHPTLAYWGMPRRIRLSLDDQRKGTCSLSGTRGPVVTSYQTLSHGENYASGFAHPLTPYTEPKKAGDFAHAVKGKSHGLPYVDWPALVAPVPGRRPARVVLDAPERLQSLRWLDRASAPPRLWAFGFDMDNAKARRWSESITPTHRVGLADEQPREERRELLEAFGAQLAALVAASEETRKALERGIAGAIAHRHHAGFKPPYWEALRFTFWSRTESDFYRAVSAAEDNRDDTLPGDAANEWLSSLRSSALGLFDEHAHLESGGLDYEPGRIIEARRTLTKFLCGPKLRKQLGLPNPKKTKKGKAA